MTKKNWQFEFIIRNEIGVRITNPHIININIEKVMCMYITVKVIIIGIYYKSNREEEEEEVI